jgi:mannose-6-phosphate isomerase-like protein (cupin superfamily)
MKIVELKNAEKVPFKLDGKKIITRSDSELIHLTLKPGEILEKHTNPFDVLFYVIQGKGIIEAGEETKLVEKDSCIEIALGVERGWTNSGNEDLKILVIKLFKH